MFFFHLHLPYICQTVLLIYLISFVVVALSRKWIPRCLWKHLSMLTTWDRTIKKNQRANSLFIAAAKNSDHDIYFIPISIYCSAIPGKNAKANRSHSRHLATHLVLLYTETANHCRKLPPGISKIWKTWSAILAKIWTPAWSVPYTG